MTKSALSAWSVASRLQNLEKRDTNRYLAGFFLLSDDIFLKKWGRQNAKSPGWYNNNKWVFVLLHYSVGCLWQATVKFRRIFFFFRDL